MMDKGESSTVFVVPPRLLRATATFDLLQIPSPEAKYMLLFWY